MVLPLLVLLAADVAAQRFVEERVLTRREMIRDIDVALKQLERHHPMMYLYVDEEVFRAEVDSIKAHLPEKMVTSDFYLVLTRMIYSLRHGHIMIFPYDPDEGSLQRNVLSAFGYQVFNDSLYIVRNAHELCDIPPGTRVDELNGADVVALLRKYEDAVPSEGYSGMLRYRLISHLFPVFGMYETGVSDTVELKLSFRDSTFVCRLPIIRKHSQADLSDLILEYTGVVSPEIRRDSTGISVPGARLKFPDGQHDIAVLKVHSFMVPTIGFYREAFRMLDSLNTQHLILDLRDNLGGAALLASELYSYLSDSTFRFIERPIVNSWFRLFYPPNHTLARHVLTTVLLPFVVSVYTPIQRLEGGGFSHNAMEARRRAMSPNRFRGSVSLLVNSGTYSAAAVIAANLKHAGNVLVVGEETGGASEGTVAMRMSTKRLPASGFWLRYGLGFIQPYYQGGKPGHGVIPDLIVQPTLNDYIEEHDPQLHTLMELLNSLQREP